MKKIIINLITILTLCFLSFNSMANISFIKSHRWKNRIMKAIGITVIITGGIYAYNKFFKKSPPFKKTVTRGINGLSNTPRSTLLNDPSIDDLYGSDSDSDSDTSIEASPELTNLNYRKQIAIHNKKVQRAPSALKKECNYNAIKHNNKRNISQDAPVPLAQVRSVFTTSSPNLWKKKSF